MGTLRRFRVCKDKKVRKLLIAKRTQCVPYSSIFSNVSPIKLNLTLPTRSFLLQLLQQRSKRLLNLNASLRLLKMVKSLYWKSSVKRSWIELRWLLPSSMN